MLDDYRKSQPIVYKILSNAVFKNKLSHAYLFESNGYPKVLDVAIAFAKLIFCEQNFINDSACQSCNICNQIDTGNFPELRIIKPDDNVIKKEQLYDLQREFSKKAMIGNRKVYILSQADCLNTSSANALLKFLEEPEENIIAILITDNIYTLLDTIVSRCQVVSFSKITNQELEFYHDYDLTLLKIASCYFHDELELKRFLDSNNNLLVSKAIEFIEYYEVHRIHTLLFANKVWHSYFKDKESLSFAFHVIILYYKDVLNYLYHRELSVFHEMKSRVVKIADGHTLLSIGSMIQVFLKMKDNVMYNMNSSLLFDKMILLLEEVR